MQATARAGQFCQRCGHAERHPPGGGLARFTRRVFRLKPPRIECHAPTDLGWACPCRSRFHGS